MSCNLTGFDFFVSKVNLFDVYSNTETLLEFERKQ